MQNTFSFVLGFIVVLILATGGYMYFGKSNEAPATADVNGTVTNTMPAPGSEVPEMIVTGPEAAKTVTVTYSDSGFSPKDIEINLGDTVRFVNQSASPMWVASAPHPTHINYPEFDQKAAADKGAAYEFTFTKAGTWKYHNHRSASHTGSITVK